MDQVRNNNAHHKPNQDMSDYTVKIPSLPELPEGQSVEGIYTIGTTPANASVKVNLGKIKPKDYIKAKEPRTIEI